MSTSPTKPQSNGVSPHKPRQSKRLRGQDAPIVDDVPLGARSPRKSRARTLSQSSVGSNNSHYIATEINSLTNNEEIEASAKKPGKKNKSHFVDFEQSDESPSKPKSRSSSKNSAKLNNSIELSDNEEAVKVVESVKPKIEFKPRSPGNRRKPESHSVLLKQAVLSKDSEKFFTVICTLDTPSKRATIQDLDASFVLPTLKYINEIFRDDRLRERTSYLRDFRFTIDFMTLILEVHSGYLSTLKNLDKHLGGLVEFAQTRSANIDKLNQLEGRLSFTYEQMKLRTNPVTFREQEAPSTFVDDGRILKKAAKQVQGEKMEIS